MWKWMKAPAPEFQPPALRTEYPFGTCVETEDGWWLIREKMRFKIPSNRVLVSWGLTVIPARESAVKHYKKAGTLGFRDGTVIQDVSDGKLYMIAQNKKRHIRNPDFFTTLGFDRVPLIKVSAAEAKLHDDGEVLD